MIRNGRSTNGKESREGNSFSRKRVRGFIRQLFGISFSLIVYLSDLRSCGAVARYQAEKEMLYVLTVLVVILQTVQSLRAGPISMNAIQSIKARQIYVRCAI